jgi:hypothetical protein
MHLIPNGYDGHREYHLLDPKFYLNRATEISHLADIPYFILLISFEYKTLALALERHFFVIAYLIGVYENSLVQVELHQTND